MRLLIAAAAVCLLRVASGAPAECWDQLVPLDFNDQTLGFGKWFFIAAASDYTDFKPMMKTDWIWMDLSPIPENNTVSLRFAAMVNESCEVITVTTKISKNTLQFDSDSGSDEAHFYSCPNCLIMTSNQTLDDVTSQFLLLWGRNRTLSASGREPYVRHVECLGLRPPEYTDPLQDRCPDERNSSSKQGFVGLQVGPPPVAAGTSVSCKNLLAPRQLGDLTQIFGKWFLLYVTSDHSSITQNYKSILTEADSMFMELSPTSQDDTVLMSYTTMKHNKCHAFTSNRTIANNTLILDHDHGRDELQLITCPDCQIMLGKLHMQRKTVLSVRAWGRTRTPSASDKYTYNRITACLGLGQPVSMDPHKDLCPDKEKL